MSKIGLIIGREFNQRVRKRSFILTTLLTPLLLIGIMVAPAAMMLMKTDTTKEIIVFDESSLILPKLESIDQMKFSKTEKNMEELRQEKPDVYGYLVIGKDVLTNPQSLQLYTYESSTMEIEKNITSQVNRILEEHKLLGYNIENLPQILENVKSNVAIQAFKIDESGSDKESSSGLAMALAYLFGFAIYMFVFMYGAMVMQGVVEEKSSKVLEIIVSSVKPFELMLGKILGIASVAITQFFIWIVLIFVLGTVALQLFAGDLAQAASTSDMAQMSQGMSGMDPEAIAMLRNITDLGFLTNIFGGFLIYFIGGYLLYAAMFAAIGSAVDNIQDTQQLQLPVTIPLILAIIVMMSVMRDPNSSVAFWFSIIPFTSPIIMMARLPYGVPAWELALSITLLYASFIGMVWVAGKVYRVGIFMYGKKPTFKELYKWMKYKS